MSAKLNDIEFTLKTKYAEKIERQKELFLREKKNLFDKEEAIKRNSKERKKKLKSMELTERGI